MTNERIQRVARIVAGVMTLVFALSVVLKDVCHIAGALWIMVLASGLLGYALIALSLDNTYHYPNEKAYTNEDGEVVIGCKNDNLTQSQFFFISKGAAMFFRRIFYWGCTVFEIGLLFTFCHWPMSRNMVYMGGVCMAFAGVFYLIRHLIIRNNIQ